MSAKIEASLQAKLDDESDDEAAIEVLQAYQQKLKQARPMAVSRQKAERLVQTVRDHKVKIAELVDLESKLAMKAKRKAEQESILQRLREAEEQLKTLKEAAPQAPVKEVPPKAVEPVPQAVTRSVSQAPAPRAAKIPSYFKLLV